MQNLYHTPYHPENTKIIPRAESQRFFAGWIRCNTDFDTYCCFNYIFDKNNCLILWTKLYLSLFYFSFYRDSVFLTCKMDCDVIYSKLICHDVIVQTGNMHQWKNILEVLQLKSSNVFRKCAKNDELKFYHTGNVMKALACVRIRGASFLYSMQSIKEIEFLLD